MQSLSIPEGVKRIQYICDDDMTELSLPASLLFLECRGYPYVFGVDDYATIRYAGTKAQWENLCKVSENFVGLDDRHAEHLTVICTDGIWAQPDATPVPTATPTPSDKLPKNVSRLPNGNLRYDDGLIAFEAPDNATIFVSPTSNAKGTVYSENTTILSIRVLMPVPVDSPYNNDFVLNYDEFKFIVIADTRLGS